MALSDLYAALDFDDVDGPGCGQEAHGASCLCDVDLGAHPVAPNAEGVDYATVGYAVIATKVVGHRPFSPTDLVQWASELLGAHDAVRAAGANLRGGTERLESLRTHFIEVRGRTALSAAGAPVVRELLQLGWSLPTVANFLETTTAEVVRCLTQRSDVDVAAYATAISFLFAGRGYTEAARSSGLTVSTVRHMGIALGVKSKRSDGGGNKYDAATYEQILRLREQGLSFTEIAKATGVNRNACIGVVRRRAAA